MAILQRRVSAALWEVLVLLVAAIIFSTVYRVYFSRAVTLTQVCEKIALMQSDEAAEVATGAWGDSLDDINRLCQQRRPIRQ